MYPPNPLPGTVSHLLAAAASKPTLIDLLISFAPFFLIILVFYFIWFVPERKKQQAREGMLGNLKKGDKVITNGGLYGEVAKVEDPNKVVLKLADNVKVRIQRQAIAGLEQAEKGS